MAQAVAGVESEIGQEAARVHWRLDDLPVAPIGQPAAWFDVRCEAESVTVQPRRPLPRRCTIRPAALFEQDRGFPDLCTVMGRLVFGRGATDAQRYTPFTQDAGRALRELFLPIEAMPDDDWLNSAPRWTNAQAMARRLFSVAGVPWDGLSGRDVEELVNFVHCSEPIETCALHALVQWTRDKGDCVIEIGSFRGRSISALAMGLRAAGSGAKIVSVDPHGAQPHNRQQVRLALDQIGEGDRLVQYIGASDDARRILRPGCASLVFIDGDHSYDQVVRDFENYRSLVAPGGCLAFHDYGFGNHAGQADAQPDVRRAVDEHVLGSRGVRPLLFAQVLLTFVRD